MEAMETNAMGQMGESEPAAEKPTRYVILGGSAGGMSALAQIRRRDEAGEITVIERTGRVATGYCGLAYAIGGVIADPKELFHNDAEDLGGRFRARILGKTTVESIRVDRKVVMAKSESGEEMEIPYDKLIIALGADAAKPNVQGGDLEGVMALRDTYDMERILGWAKSKEAPPKSAIIVGGGFIGLEMAESQAHRGIRVTVLEAGREIMPRLDKEIIRLLMREIASHGVRVVTEAKIAAIAKGEGGSLRVDLGSEILKADGVIWCAGVAPNSRKAFCAGLDLGVTGGIKVDSRMATSDPDIYCIGDVAEVRCKHTEAPTLPRLAVPLAHQAKVAAANATGHNAVYHGTSSTFITKVFGMAVGATGQTERQLKQGGWSYRKIFQSAPSHIGFYPGRRLCG